MENIVTKIIRRPNGKVVAKFSAYITPDGKVVKHGEYEGSRGDGSLYVFGHYVHNLRTGVWSYFDKKETLSEEVYYEEGKVIKRKKY